MLWHFILSIRNTVLETIESLTIRGATAENTLPLLQSPRASRLRELNLHDLNDPPGQLLAGIPDTRAARRIRRFMVRSGHARASALAPLFETGKLPQLWSLTIAARDPANVGLEAEGEELGKGAMAGMIAFSLLFAVGLFFLVPVFASKALEGVLGSDLASNIAEGAIRLGLFFAYIVLIGRMSEIKRVFMYHGAEHMTVHAQERGDPLDIESVRKYPTAHPRCGTAFLLVVMVVSILAFVFIGRDPLWWLITSRVVLIPVIAAVSYEMIRFSGFHASNPLVQLITGPSLALQALTTRQPDDDQIEIAIAAMQHTLDADQGKLPDVEDAGQAEARVED